MKIIREAFGQIVNKVRPISKKLHKIEINENDNEWKLIQIVSDFGEKFADYNDQHFVLKPTSSLKYNKRVIENAFALTLDYYEKHGKIDSLKFVFPQIALFVDYDE